MAATQRRLVLAVRHAAALAEHLLYASSEEARPVVVAGRSHSHSSCRRRMSAWCLTYRHDCQVSWLQPGEAQRGRVQEMQRALVEELLALRRDVHVHLHAACACACLHAHVHVHVARACHTSVTCERVHAQACRPRLSQAPSTATRRSAARARDLLPRQPRALVPRAAASPAALGTRALAGESAADRERVARSTVRRPVAAAPVARLVEDVEGLPGSAMPRQAILLGCSRRSLGCSTRPRREPQPLRPR